MNFERVIAVRNSKIVYRDGDNCIKVFSPDCSKADVLNEAMCQARIEETGMRIPHIKSVAMLEGKWTIVSEYIAGKTLSRLMTEHPEKKAEYLELFVNLQIEIHNYECPHLGKLKDKMAQNIDVAELSATTRYDLFARIDEMPKHNKVCHGDYTPSNVVITDDGTPYILDWSYVARGEVTADAAITYISFLLSGDKQDAEDYLKLYCEKTATDRKMIEKWLPIAAAYKSVDCSESERDYLLSLAETTD